MQATGGNDLGTIELGLSRPAQDPFKAATPEYAELLTGALDSDLEQIVVPTSLITNETVDFIVDFTRRLGDPYPLVYDKVLLQYYTLNCQHATDQLTSGRQMSIHRVERSH